ncbi:MAG: UDP-4-amino-4,6-dideoxy-N-acetyl-beta-L-altrosamine transaminase [Chitinophagaceae bacterium]|nr:MAG: UDP-4-amino-4,6-dideoxy-N-acetyl-beta-L-altrosamine transaminase [Chitinophagaceae bacterium]
MTNTIPYGKQSLSQGDIDAVISVLQSDFWTQGPKVAEFEAAFAEYIGCKYAVAVSNGTAALHLCALALDVNENSNVITTPITFAASANCIKYCGGHVYFADIDPETVLLDINAVKALIESKPKGFFSGIIPVDFAGAAVNLEEYRQLADAHGLWIIEDACHAPGGYFNDSKGKKQFCGNGAYADLSIFSFHPVKHIACGEGGMITTNDEKLYKKLIQLRTHGITKDPASLTQNDGGWYYEMQTLGYNYRIPDVLCALGVSQLSRANDGLKRRREIAEKYRNAFEGTGVKMPRVEEGHAYHLFIIQSPMRKELYDFLKANNVFCQVHYIPVHLQPYYKELGHKKGDYPNSESYYDECLSLPMYPTLTNEEQEYVINLILDFHKKAGLQNAVVHEKVNG